MEDTAFHSPEICGPQDVMSLHDNNLQVISPDAPRLSRSPSVTMEPEPLAARSRPRAWTR
jgi:hypothetical protein